MRVNSRSTRALVVVVFIGSLILFAPQPRSGASTTGCASTARTTPVISRGTLFFTATDGTHGRELWKSDGTCTGTALVDDIRPGHGSSEVNELTEISGTVFFRANDGTHGAQVWKTDGTKAGTVMLTDIALGDAGPSPNGLTASGSTLFFVAYSTSISGDPELWKSDGTVAGTVMVKDLMLTSTSGGFAYVGHPIDVSGTLFFGAQEGGGDGELWKSDGTTAGTLVLKHFGQTQAFSEPSLVGSIGRTLLFVADDGVSGGELWRSDGTESGTEIVRDIAPGQSSSMPLGSGAGTELGPYYLLGMLVGDELYFDAFNASLGFELWKSDGTTDGTQLVKDIFPGPKSSASTGSMLTQAGGKVYFAAQTRPHAWGLWTSDGTAAGTQMLVRPSTDATWLNATAVGGVAFVVDELSIRRVILVEDRRDQARNANGEELQRQGLGGLVSARRGRHTTSVRRLGRSARLGTLEQRRHPVRDSDDQRHQPTRERSLSLRSPLWLVHHDWECCVLRRQG